MLEAIADRLQELLDASGKDFESTSVRVEHNVVKPDFVGDLYTAEATDADGRKTEVSWTIGDRFKDDLDFAPEVAQRLADRILGGYAPEAE